jgi:hypothetical protein
VAHELTMQIVAKYDYEVFLLILLVVYKALTPNCIIIKLIGYIVVELVVYGSLGFFKTNLFIFRRIVVAINPFSLLIW